MVAASVNPFAWKANMRYQLPIFFGRNGLVVSYAVRRKPLVGGCVVGGVEFFEGLNELLIVARYEARPQ